MSAAYTFFPPLAKEKPDWARTNSKRPCQICGESGFCEVADNIQVAHCMNISAGGIPSNTRLGGAYHKLVGIRLLPQATAAGLRPAQPSSGKEEVTPLSKETINQLNQTFYGYLELSDKHRDYLQAAGVPGRWLNLCRSLRQKEAAKLALRLVDRYGEQVCERHPLLVKLRTKDGKRTWWTIAGAADGILFPAFNLEGQLLGFQLRKSEPKGSNDRYIWLSHDGLGGTPLTTFQALPGAENSHMVIASEGFKKAAPAAEHWGCHGISLAGVSAYKEMELVKEIEGLGVSVIALAFDQDKRQKPQVQKAETRLLNLLAVMLPEVSIYILNWDIEKGKGLDDALLAGAEFKFDPAVNDGPRYCTNLPAEAHARAFGTFKPYYTLAEARNKHKQLFAKLLTRPDGSKTALISPTGTGKSQSADDELAHALQTNQLKGRWALLAPNKANIVERTGPNTALGKAVTTGQAVIQLGRNLIDLADPTQKRTAHDCANPAAQDAGANRQIAAKVVCKDCFFGSQDNWDRQFPGQPRAFKCEVDGYIASRKKSEKAQVVIATKESFLNNSEQLDDFDGIICDEELLDYLIEKIRS